MGVQPARRGSDQGGGVSTVAVASLERPGAVMGTFPLCCPGRGPTPLLSLAVSLQMMTTLLCPL